MREYSYKNFELPSVVFGTSGLGNLFLVLDDAAKLEIVKQCVSLTDGKCVFDSAGKYGAGLALEVLGRCLRQLNVDPANVLISNKLGWYQTELTTEEPTFEPGVWKGLQNDAVQKISYRGILECFEQGNRLLNGYNPAMVSVHDPDEYVANAKDEQQALDLYQDVLEAYRALHDLKQQGKVQAIGVGAKDWKIIERIANDVSLDWIMIANSMTIQSHPESLRAFISEADKKGIHIINSAVFHSGFLVGGDYYNYQRVDEESSEGKSLLEWRNSFFEVCAYFNVSPATACVQFALNVPGIKSIALNTTNAKRVKENLEMVNAQIPIEFWSVLQAKNLVKAEFLSMLQPTDGK